MSDGIQGTEHGFASSPAPRSASPLGRKKSSDLFQDISRHFFLEELQGVLEESLHLLRGAAQLRELRDQRSAPASSQHLAHRTGDGTEHAARFFLTDRSGGHQAVGAGDGIRDLGKSLRRDFVFEETEEPPIAFLAMSGLSPDLLARSVTMSAMVHAPKRMSRLRPLSSTFETNDRLIPSPGNVVVPTCSKAPNCWICTRGVRAALLGALLYFQESHVETTCESRVLLRPIPDGS